MPRPPMQPSRTELDADEVEAFDAIVEAGTIALEVQRDGAKVFSWNHKDLFDDYYGRMLINPLAARAIRLLGGAVRRNEYSPDSGSFSPADHELIDLVLSFDSGYWAFLRIHTPSAVIAGVSVDTIEALRDSHDEALDDDTRFVVGFIRAVANGELTDDSWNRMEERLGSERGVFDFAVLVLTLQLHLRLSQLLKVEPIPDDEYSAMLSELRRPGVVRSIHEARQFVRER